MSETITVLVPTRERSDTLKDCLSTCVSQADDNLRILVSDNASQDATSAVVKGFQARDRRVEYINPGARLGMPEHWEFAVEHVRDGFVIVIGDDDALFPDAIAAMREILKSHPKTRAISWPYSFYGYPSLFTPAKNHLALAFDEQSEIRKSDEWLAKLAAFETFYFELPMVYHGLVHTSVLDRIRSRTGRVISALNPDIYLVIAVAASTECYYRLSRSLSLCGTSRNSTGASAFAQHGASPIVRAFFNETRLPLHPSVPYLPSVPVFVLESLLQARDAGLMPDDVRIAYERCVSLAFTELYSAGYSEKAFTDYLGRLEELCGRIGQTAHLEELKGYDSTARKALRDELAIHWSPRHQIVVNLGNTTVKDVAGAVDVAEIISGNELLRDMFVEMSSRIREVSKAFDDRLSQLRELDAVARNQQMELQKCHVELTERIASLGQQLVEAHAESTARFHQIEKLTELLKNSNKLCAKRQAQIDQLMAVLGAAKEPQGETENTASTQPN